MRASRPDDLTCENRARTSGSVPLERGDVAVNTQLILGVVPTSEQRRLRAHSPDSIWEERHAQIICSFWFDAVRVVVLEDRFKVDFEADFIGAQLSAVAEGLFLGGLFPSAVKTARTCIRCPAQAGESAQGTRACAGSWPVARDRVEEGADRGVRQCGPGVAAQGPAGGHAHA